MKLYYAEGTVEGSIKLFVVEHHDRHKLWVSNPAAREISKKQYDEIVESVKKANLFHNQRQIIASQPFFKEKFQYNKTNSNDNLAQE